MNNSKLKLPAVKAQPLYRFKKPVALFETTTTTQTDPTTSTSTVLTTTHIWQK